MKRATFSAAHYRVVASIIRDIDDDETRRDVARRFGAAFNARSPDYFDMAQWERATTVASASPRARAIDDRPLRRVASRQ